MVTDPQVMLPATKTRAKTTVQHPQFSTTRIREIVTTLSRYLIHLTKNRRIESLIAIFVLWPQGSGGRVIDGEVVVLVRRYMVEVVDCGGLLMLIERRNRTWRGPLGLTCREESLGLE